MQQLLLRAFFTLLDGDKMPTRFVGRPSMRGLGLAIFDMGNSTITVVEFHSEAN